MKYILYILLFNLSLFSFELQKPKIYNDQNISGWYMSEKLDGIRGYWDGEKLYTKNGNEIIAPQWFVKNFPPFALDGELWSKRGDFEFIQSTVLDKAPSNHWKKITYNIFEVPNAKGTFLSRLQEAKKWFELHPNLYVKIIKQLKCNDEADLLKYLNSIIVLGGEGVIVKDPTVDYDAKRSSHILKVKKSHDMEGKVIGHNLRDDGTLKSLILELENGITFNLGGGFTKEQRVKYPKLGEIITFQYYDFTKNGKPKFASFLRIREKE